MHRTVRLVVTDTLRPSNSGTSISTTTLTARRAAVSSYAREAQTDRQTDRGGTRPVAILTGSGRFPGALILALCAPPRPLGLASDSWDTWEHYLEPPPSTLEVCKTGDLVTHNNPQRVPPGRSAKQVLRPQPESRSRRISPVPVAISAACGTNTLVLLQAPCATSARARAEACFAPG